ncbi:hypothetical protein SDC9_93015 [bioreactor metagenome]|uniref:Uncharacterized protein n=1 Tax=bioreactor metagenome TaxID=1076179 RepID=A0A644ZZV4_9ZZZZ
MSQNRSEDALREAQEAIASAEQLLEASAATRAQAGASSLDEARAQLESQLSAEDIAMVEAQVHEEITRIQDDIKARRMHSGNSSASASAGGAVRRSRQMI